MDFLTSTYTIVNMLIVQLIMKKLV